VNKPKQDPYAPGGRLHWIKVARPSRRKRGRPTNAERARVLNQDRDVAILVAGLAEMCEDGDLIFDGEKFKLAERVMGGLA
jgi:hypothetical protein